MPCPWKFSNDQLLIAILLIISFINHSSCIAPARLDGLISTDTNGNLHIHAPTNGDVVVNGIGVSTLLKTVHTLETELERVNTACNTLSYMASAKSSAPASTTLTTSTASSTTTVLTTTSTTTTAPATTATAAPSSICSSNSKPIKIPTAGGYAMDSITVNGTTYLSVASYFDGSAFALNSTIYVWDPSMLSFVFFQNISTTYAVQARFFMIKSSLYLLVSAFGPANLNATSEFFIFNATSRRFQSFQRVQTHSAFGFTHFTIGTDAFVAIANNNDGSTAYLDSYIMNFSPLQNRFIHYQNITASFVYGLDSFTMMNDTFLTLASYRIETNYNVNSSIFRYNTFRKAFELFQNITTQGCPHLRAFKISTDQFLAASNSFNPKLVAKYVVSSEIFRFNISSNRFVSIQLLPTIGAFSLESMHINGFSFLFAASYYDGSTSRMNSTLYLWNAANKQFMPYQIIPTMYTTIATHFTIGPDAFLATPSLFDSGSYYRNSSIYKWCGNQFVLN